MDTQFIHFLVTGRVQGVGFRAFTNATAKNLELYGWVRNLNDGRVEGVALGSNEKIERFVKSLKKGPLFAKVSDLFVEQIEGIESFTFFEIAKDSHTTWVK